MFQATSENKERFMAAYKSVGCSESSRYMIDRRDSSSANIDVLPKKTRTTENYTTAKERFKVMMGTDGDDDDFEHAETMYILRCLDTSCSVFSLFTALNYYFSHNINSIS